MSNKRRMNVKWDSSTEEDTRDGSFERNCKAPSYKLKSPVSGDEIVETRRRGRGPSKRPCLNRNALMARENRQRKKAYLEKIENKLSFYQEENKNLANMIQKQGIDIKRLNGEVAYLRSVLNNNTSITALLRTINNGLRKLSSGKREILHDTCLKTEENNVRHKCSCYMNSKENLTNGFIMPSTNQFGECNIQNGNDSSYISNRKHLVDCKNPISRTPVYPFIESDHTYTALKHSTASIKSEVETKELENINAAGSTSPSREFENLMEVVQPISTSDEKKDTDGANTDFDQLPSFNIDIFEDIPKCDEIMSPVDNLYDATSLFNEEVLFQSLDNAGICLHVNSDKVSLEFCSICHSNSKNTGVD